MSELRERWGGRLPFIMAAIGSAVGLGNVWRFPYVAYKNGGGAFFIPYFVALITAGIPLLILEYSLGQKFQSGAPGVFNRIGRGWRWLGWFAIFIGLSISFYYIQVMALSWDYMFASVTQAWEKPIDNRTVFKQRFRIYRSDFEKGQIEAELKRKHESHVRLVAAKDADRVKDILSQVIREEWGTDVILYTEVDQVVDHAEAYLTGREALDKEDPKVRFSVLSDAEYGRLDGALAAYYAGVSKTRYEKAGPDDDYEVLDEEKIRVVARQDNAGLYFMDEALGGFGTWAGKAGRATGRTDLVDRAVAILDDPAADLDRLFAKATPEELAASKKEGGEPNPDWDFATAIPPLSKHAASAYRKLREVQSRVKTAKDSASQQAAGKDLAAAKADLKAALEVKRLEREGTFAPSWHLVFWALLTWVIIFLIIFKGVHVVGKVVMLTVPLPILLLGILIVHGLTLDGAGQGIEFLLNPDWGVIKDPSVWIAAYGQIFFSLSLGFGIMIAYASYMPRESDVSNNAFMTSFGNCCTSFYASFAVFSVLGYLAMALNSQVDDVVSAGPGLVFVTYPIALSEMGGAGSVVGVLFFLSLLTLGIDSAFSIVEAVITGLKDSFSHVNKTALTAVVCAVGFLATCWYCTRSGLMWLDVVDNWMNNYGLPVVGLLECIAVGYFFSLDEIRAFVNERSDIQIKGWWDACIKVVTPLILFVIIFQQVLTDLTTTYGDYDKVVPWAVNLAGWGYFGGLILIAFLVTRSWLHVAWTATAVVVTLLLKLGGLPTTHAVLGGVGFMLLFGGLGTCIWIARKTDAAKALAAAGSQDQEPEPPGDPGAQPTP